MTLPEWLKPNSLSPLALFLRSLALSALGIGCGSLLFPSEASLVGVGLFAFSQGKTVEALLNRNRDEIWGEVIPPARANLKLAMSLMVIFLGVFTTYLFAVQLVAGHFNSLEPVERLFDKQIGDFGAGRFQDIDFEAFALILKHNAGVLFACFSFALIYRHAGMLLVLSWNASVWGAVFSYLSLVATENDTGVVASSVDPVLYASKTLVCILPHLVSEAVAYVLVAMAGVFTSLGIARHKIGSDSFMQVTRAILNIFLYSIAWLCLAAAVEAYGAPALRDLVFG
jgi:uncharacterized membrane protein SpoIIM required for sporulation